MAIKDTKTNFYYKVNFEESMIKGRNVIPNVEIYLSEQERLKEKERSSEVSSVLMNINKASKQLYNNLMTIMSQYDLSDIAPYVEEDGLTIKKDLFPEAYEIQKKHLVLDDLYYRLLRPEYFKRSSTFKGELKPITEDELKALQEYGFKREWVTDPIIIVDNARMTIAEYMPNENIDTAYYYNKLKPNMQNICIDC